MCIGFVCIVYSSYYIHIYIFEGFDVGDVPLRKIRLRLFFVDVVKKSTLVLATKWRCETVNHKIFGNKTIVFEVIGVKIRRTLGSIAIALKSS